MGGDASISAVSLAQRFPRAAGFLFDSHTTGQAGGSGHAFDWSRIPRDCPRPWRQYVSDALVLAGRGVAHVQGWSAWALEHDAAFAAQDGVRDAILEAYAEAEAAAQ